MDTTVKSTALHWKKPKPHTNNHRAFGFRLLTHYSSNLSNIQQSPPILLSSLDLSTICIQGIGSDHKVTSCFHCGLLVSFIYLEVSPVYFEDTRVRFKHESRCRVDKQRLSCSKIPRERRGQCPYYGRTWSQGGC